MDVFRGVDHGSTYWFDHLAKTNEHLLPVFSTGCFLSSPWVAAFFLGLAVWLLTREQQVRTGLILAFCFILGAFLVEGLSLLIRRPPSSFGTNWLKHPGFFAVNLQNSYSTFPSASMFLSTFVWASLFFLSRKLNWHSAAAFGVALLGMAIVFGGFMCHLLLSQHYLSDLLAGLVGGAGLAFVAWSYDRADTPLRDGIMER